MAASRLSSIAIPTLTVHPHKQYINIQYTAAAAAAADDDD